MLVVSDADLLTVANADVSLEDIRVASFADLATVPNVDISLEDMTVLSVPVRVE